MLRVNELRIGCIVALLLQTAACAGTRGAFAARYPDNDETDLKQLVRRLAAAPQRSTPAIAAGVSANGLVYGYDLAARRVLWQVPARPRFAPQLAGDAVVLQEGERVIGLDLKTGASRFQFDATGMHLVGADGAGDSSVVALTSGQGTFAKSHVVLIASGVRRWLRELNTPVGVPAIVGNVVLVPWSSQYLSGLDAGTGDEFARLRVRDAVVSHAFVSGGHVFAGSQHGIAAITPSILGANLQQGPHYAAPQQELPGRPVLLHDAYASTPLPEPQSAQNRVRMTFAPQLGSGDQVQMAGGQLYLVFYRFVFALDPTDLSLHWVHTHEVDLVGARAQADGLLVADARGEIRYLGAEAGATQWVENNGPAAVDLEFPGDLRAGAAASGGQPSPLSLRQQLAAAAQDADSRLVPVRLLAVELLAKLDDPGATQDLLALCEDDRTTVGIRKAACNALRQRKNGNEHVLAALARHAAFLDGTSAPPIGALAKAAATQKESRATPLLIAHLQDPNTPTQGLAELIRALGELKEASAGPALAEFLMLYHADAIDEHLAQALEQTPQTLVKLVGAAARPTLTKVAEDPLSAGNVQESARKALAALDQQAKAGERDPEAQKLAEQQAVDAAEAAKKEAPRVPAHITVDVIRQALLPVHDQLKACIASAKPDAFQARVVLVIEDGQVLMVSVLPEHLQSCIEPLVRAQSFPLTQTSQRERISYTIKRM